MNKLKSFSLVAALALALCGCAEATNEPPKPDAGDGMAYLSIKANFQSGTRASGEDKGTGESDLKSLYIVTFNAADQIVSIPGGSFYIPFTGASAVASPEPKLVSAATKKIMVIANPGAGLLTALNSLNATSTLGSFNTAVSGITVTDLHTSTSGFAMISTPSDVDSDGTPLPAGGTITTPLIEVGKRLKVVTGSTTPEAALNSAKTDPLAINLERLTSKVVFKPVGTPTVPTNAKFSFIGWTLDAVNSTYFPWAKKTIIGGGHTGTAYKSNFYTTDPNFDDVTVGWPGSSTAIHHSGLVYTKIDPATFAPLLPWSGHYGWKKAATTDIAYLVENTMAATAQRYGNATRVVIKGTYTPPGCTEDADWFNWAGVNYPDFASLKTAYVNSSAGPLRTACDAFASKVIKHLGAKTTATKFEELSTADLDKVANGGEVVKEGDKAVIRWYQKGLNYYFYEIRHNNAEKGTMALGKYGVVRNNWYNLSLDNVRGAGTPWYPDLLHPGEGDPDPRDPIDEDSGYIGITVSPQPWIIWETGISI